MLQSAFSSPPLHYSVGISADNVLGPYFFENDDGTTSTVTGEKYRSMIRNFMIPEIERLELTTSGSSNTEPRLTRLGGLWHR